MAVLLISGNPVGLRALGSGGRTAASSYEQIARTMRHSLGPEHAALFAEPNRRSNMIDWFANVDSGASIRLIDAPYDLKQAGLTTLSRLVQDIETKATALQKSDRPDERILGDMLAHSLEVPGENAVYLVGHQPVMTFWGYVRDQGTPVVPPLRALLAQKAGGLAPSAAKPTKDLLPPPIRSTKNTSSSLESSLQAGRWLAVGLWTIFTLLLLTLGVELLRGCAIGLPYNLTGWLLDYCPSGPDTTVSVDLATERARQDQFRAEYEELVRQVALKRQACIMEKKSPQPVIEPKPIEVPPIRKDVIKPNDKDQLHIPDKKPDSFAFLEGCWRAHRGLTEIRNGKDTGKQLKMTFCFKGDGSGSRTIRYLEDNARCVGSATASFDKDVLTVQFGEATCDGGHGGFRGARATCHRGEDGVAICEEFPQGENKPDFTDFPFIRSTEAP